MLIFIHLTPQKVTGACTLLCLLLSPALAGCSQSGKKHPGTETPQTQQKQEEPKPESQTTGTEPGETSVKCPGQDDARKSIEEGKTLLVEIRDTLQDPTKSDFSDRAKALEEKLSTWKQQNSALSRDCSMLLGADGTSVFPEIPLALENLTLSGEWMQKAIDVAGVNAPRTGAKYIKGAERAIKQASRVLDKKVKLDRRTAVVKPPE